ncbi:hypothetical protein Taro_046539 [Colocasia esculenta]|uniref:Uncharacterized protein n=1 Tax=Colocasia esculenta TaxID=4460 RepID=A0A843X698_COLES|nr:hypothetical protein [Colocasia esculenta]
MNSSLYKLRPSDESVKVAQNLGVGNSTLPSWVDCVTNISMGQLLSETPDVNLSNPLPSARNPSFKQIPMNCDSFDVAIADLLARNQGSQSSTQMLHSSIWEAEETRHAFPNQEASFSRNDVSVASYKSPIQDHPSEEQVADLKSDPHDHSGRVNANSQLEPQVLHSDMSNLGLSNLCWGDSLGPFEFGEPPKHINVGDTISLSGLIGNSLDAFQNSSVFGIEKIPSS